MKEKFEQMFDQVDDPRSCRNQRHPFVTLIGTTFLAALSGVDSFSGIQDFTESHLEELSKYFEFPSGFASHDTYQRFWDAISPTQFQKAFYEFTQTIMTLPSRVISVDGKTIRNSGQNVLLHMVSAWCQNNQLVMAQEKVHAKSNEITAIPRLLELLDLQDKIITIDAIGAQRPICEQIISKNGDYVISLKANQTNLHEDVIAFFNQPEPYEFTSEQTNKGHGRTETRIACTSHQIDEIKKKHNWPGLQSIGVIESKVIRKGKDSSDRRFYISSLRLNAEQLNEIVRSHWGIENKLHWRLDVVFNEDRACIRNDNAAENISTVRKWALNIAGKAKTKPDQSIKSVMRKNAMSFKHLMSALEKIFHA